MMKSQRETEELRTTQGDLIDTAAVKGLHQGVVNELTAWLTAEQASRCWKVSSTLSLT